MNEIISELLSDKCFTSAWTKSSKMAKSTVYFNLENSKYWKKVKIVKYWKYWKKILT